MEDIERFFGNSVLHDYEISGIEISYSEGTIFFNFIDSKKEKKSYLVKQFISITFTKHEEWGTGKYVVFSSVVNNHGLWTIEIQLNSGDICIVKCYK